MSDVVVRPPSHPRIDAAAVARQYADDVISGRVVAGKLVKLAAKRFLRDLKNGHLRGLRFDAVEAQRVVDFFGLRAWPALERKAEDGKENPDCG